MSTTMIQDPLGRTKPVNRQIEYPPSPPREFATFAEWEAGAEATAEYDYGSGGNQNTRVIYRMLGYDVFHETHVPWSPFKDMTQRCFPASFDVTRDSDEIKLAEKFGGQWGEGYYADEGKGWPVFGGEDCMERLWNYLTAWLAFRKKRKAAA